jgi:site-specific recombinase XerD
MKDSALLKPNESSRFPVLKSQKVGDCFIRVTLDTRHASREGKLPVAICFHQKGKKWYYHLDMKLTGDEFVNVCKATGRGRVSASSEERPYEVKIKLEAEFDKYYNMVVSLSRSQKVTISAIKTMITGVGDDVSFLKIWEAECAKKSIGTAASYRAARNSFVKYLGDIKGFKVSPSDIQKWNDALVAEGISKTTVGIYLRACRVIWYACEKMGYVLHSDYPFGKDDNKVSIPKGNTRKKYYLTVEQMTELYNCFVEKRYPAEWDTDWRDNAHYSLGLFLVQYLCNGFNLADAAHLTYNEHYFTSGRQSFQFVRQKTEERSEVEVVIPIIPPLQVILDEIAAPPVKGTLVFPGIYGDAQTLEQKKSRVAMENQNVKKRVRRLVESLGWTVQPSGTWCRHSFATNLTHAGVPHNYISESMGHSVDNNITNRYIDAFPLSKQIYFNSKLLNLHEVDETSIMAELEGLTLEQIKEIVALVKNKR